MSGRCTAGGNDPVPPGFRTVQARPAVDSVDLSADMVASAQRSLGSVADRATALVANVTGLPFPDHSST